MADRRSSGRGRLGRALLGGFALALACAGPSVPAETPADPEVFQIDVAHSSAGFKVRHLFNQTTGRFTDFTGALQYDPARPENSSIEITIRAASIDTANENRDNHLRGSDFFDVEKHPTIVFRSTKIEPTDQENRYRVTGDFTMLGVTRPIVVTVDALGFADLPGMGYRGGFSATATINRKDFGMQWNKLLDAGGTLLGDDVQVEFPLQVVRQSP
ncbi:MAG: YceI family protein [Candidatus Eisenbacteria bacterium]|uniref:YceI family protein n=1 Tax=Eiseniibacteriota bacterium TaxID=2212470 RepID=A0A938BR22_UNCEI|nr:YceI family protein [Candidatus Eisenbacteria bacterium]